MRVRQPRPRSGSGRLASLARGADHRVHAQHRRTHADERGTQGVLRRAPACSHLDRGQRTRPPGLPGRGGRHRNLGPLNMARIVWVPAYQPGSLYPAVPIVLELLRRGHRVTAICESRSEPFMRSLGCEFRPTSQLGEYLSRTGRPAPVPAAMREWHDGYVAAHFKDLVTGLAAAPQDLLLVDALEIAGGFAAEAAGLPWSSYVHFAMDEAGVDTPFSFHFWDRTSPAAPAFVNWWNGLRTMVGLGPEARPAADHVWFRGSPELSLVLGLPALMHPLTAPPKYVVRVGPSLWAPAPEPGTADLVSRIGRDRAAILASVSTLQDADLEVVRLVGQAAEAESLDVVATLPGKFDVSALPANVTAVPFVNHDLLLDRVSLVACQAGYGTVNRAACAGIPMLLFPDGRDRFNAARGAVAAGVAISLEPDKRSPEDVLGAIRSLSTVPSYRLRSRALAAAAAGYDAPATSADAVEELLVTRGAANATPEGGLAKSHEARS